MEYTILHQIIVSNWRNERSFYQFFCNEVFFILYSWKRKTSIEKTHSAAAFDWGKSFTYLLPHHGFQYLNCVAGQSIQKCNLTPNMSWGMSGPRHACSHSVPKILMQIKQDEMRSVHPLDVFDKYPCMFDLSNGLPFVGN